MADTRQGLMNRDVRSGRLTSFDGRPARRGFTLIEVVVALSILVVVVLALVASYSGYYANVLGERYRTIGENLVRLQVEDVQGLASSVLSIIVGETDEAGEGIGIYLPNYPEDKDSDPSVYKSGRVDGALTIEGLSEIDGTIASESSPDTFPGLVLPASIQIAKTDPAAPPSYSITLYKEAFPNYLKEIEITDETPLEPVASKKIYAVEITIFWTVNGVEKSATFLGERNDARTQGQQND